jgi:pilus assembly protein CpaC
MSLFNAHPHHTPTLPPSLSPRDWPRRSTRLLCCVWALSLGGSLTAIAQTEPTALAATSAASASRSNEASAARGKAREALAQPAAGPVERGLPLRLVAGKSTLLSLPHDVVRVSVGNPEIADVVITQPREVYLLGKKSGQTNLMLWGRQANTRLHDISVGTDTDTLQAKMLEWVPGVHGLRVESLGEHLLLSGLAPDAIKAQRLLHMAEAFGGDKKVINLLRIGSAQQVMLEVKIAEVSKTLLDELGVNLNLVRSAGNTSVTLLSQLLAGSITPDSIATGNASGSTLGFRRTGTAVDVTARADKDLVKILAEPTITAIHGQEGSFLAGGRIYIPVPQTSAGGGSTITLEEKEFGVGLRFVPTVLEDGLINLRVTPEVSELAQNGTQIRNASNTVTSLLPAITTRRASTTVQLRDGESFVIGGLIKNNVTEAIKAFPVLGELPIIGALFRSTSFQNEKSELLFVVTPRLAQAQTQRPALPTDRFVPPSRSELFMGGRLEGQAADAAPATTPPPAEAASPATPSRP